MFVSGMFIPLDQVSTMGVYAAFLSPLSHTLGLIRLGMGGSSYFGWLDEYRCSHRMVANVPLRESDVPQDHNETRVISRARVKKGLAVWI